MFAPCGPEAGLAPFYAARSPAASNNGEGCAGADLCDHLPNRQAAGDNVLDLGALERQLAGVTLAPYIVRAMRLIDVPRKAGSNMFRHQMSTLAILLDYKTTDPVLLKASVIHDLFEEAAGLPGVTREAIEVMDADGPAVYALVQEVSIRLHDGVRESKAEYLERLMTTGSDRGKRLKLADRISNLITLGFVNDRAFVERYLKETRAYILPHAPAVNADMARELADLVSSREQGLKRWQGEPATAPGPAGA
jgi:GTP pyrophosphokinase